MDDIALSPHTHTFLKINNFKTLLVFYHIVMSPFSFTRAEFGPEKQVLVSKHQLLIRILSIPTQPKDKVTAGV